MVGTRISSVSSVFSASSVLLIHVYTENAIKNIFISMAQIDAAFPVNFVKYRISATHVSEHWTLWESIQADMKTSEKEKHAESAQKICIHTFNLKRHLMPHVCTNRIHNQKSSFFRESRTDIRFYHFRNFSITNVNELISAPRTSTKKRRRRRRWKKRGRCCYQTQSVLFS